MGCGCGEQITVQPDCGCHGSTAPANTICNDCRADLQACEIAPLTYVYGLDIHNCRKYQKITDVLGLKACDGSNVSSATPLVTCTLFRSTLCDTLVQLPSNGVATALTKLVGADCQVYTLPSSSVGSSLTVLDTPTIDLTLTPSQVLSGNVKVSSTAGNTLATNSDGLYVPTPPSAVAVADTSCINLDLTAGVITAVPILDASTCNAVQCGPNGLFVAEATSAGDMTPESVQYEGPVNASAVITLPLISLDIENPSACRPAIVSINLLRPAFCVVGANPLLTKFDVLVQFSLPGVRNEAEFVYQCIYMNKSGDTAFEQERGWTYTVPAGFVGTVTARVRITQVAGNLTNTVVNAPVLRYHLSTI